VEVFLRLCAYYAGIGESGAVSYCIYIGESFTYLVKGVNACWNRIMEEGETFEEKQDPSTVYRIGF
jgi:hypothetical protein